MKFIIFISFIIFYCFSFQNSIQAQGRGEDPTFITGTGFNGTVTQIVLQPDEKILVRGNFTEYNGTPANRIIRLNSDGSRDESFQIGTGFNNTVYKIVLQSDGKVVLGGDFTEYNGISANRIIRLNADGSRDTSYGIGTGFNNLVNCIALQSDGKILVIGSFTTYNGISYTKPVIRLNTDGTIDNSFQIDLREFNSPMYINFVGVQPSGKIIIKGDFRNATDSYTCLRLDENGILDPTFDKCQKFHGVQHVIAFIQANGKIWNVRKGGSGNNFYNAYLYPDWVSQLDVDGKWEGNNLINTFDGFLNNGINEINDQPDGKILMLGYICPYGKSFTPQGYVACNGGVSYKIIRFNVDGSMDYEFNIGSLFDKTVSSTAIQTDGKILIGGSFTAYDGLSRNRIIRLIDGFAPLKANEILMYPNPISDNLNLLTNPNSIWQITDTFGKVLMAGKIKEPNAQIDIRGLSHGMYIFHLIDPQGNKIIKRIVKQ